MPLGKLTLPMKLRHGTLATYNNERCRCKSCRAANASYHRRYKRERSIRVQELQEELNYIRGRLAAYEEA